MLNLGNIAAAAVGDTVFRINAASGVVTKVSGTGARTSPGTARAEVMVRCTGGNRCNSTPIRVRVGSAGSSTGRVGGLTNFTVASGTASIQAMPAAADPIEFTLAPIGRNNSATFWVGADLSIRGDDSGLPTGSAAAAFNVRIAAEPNIPALPGMSAQVATTVRRATTIIKTSDLAFGALMRPASGSGIVTVDPFNGSRVVTGTGANGLPAPSPTRAIYAISGEGGRTVSISLPDAFEMRHSSQSDALVVTLVPTSTTLTLSGTTGQGGTAELGVGGSFQLSSGSAPGDYIGTFMVTVQYE